MAWAFVVAASALLLPRAPAPRHTARLAMCAEPPVAFDAALGALLNDAEASGSLDGAVDRALGTLDEGFIPQLAATIASASPADPRAPRLAALMEVLQRRSLGQFDRAREQLQELLGAGEITKMDAALCKLVREGKADAGLFYVLFRNMEDARKEGDNTTEKLLSHIHTRLQEELEKKSEPGMALLHKLTRTAEAGLRGNILRHYLVPQSTVRTPDGRELALSSPSTAIVTPDAFAAAVADALRKVSAIEADQDVLASTVEEIRQVAKEARQVVADAYPPADLDAFTDALTPAFASHMARGRAAPPPAPPAPG